MRRMLTVLAVVSTAALTVSPLWAGVEQPADRESPSIELGQHLVTVLACSDCHTPLKLGPHGPEPDTARLLSGHPHELVMPAPPRLGDGPWGWVGAATNTAYAGPWGVTYAPNLTPHETSGLGIWTERMFVDALRTGRHMGRSRPIQPPMPWMAYSALTDRELRSIYAYLRTIPPIDNLVPDYEEPGARDDGDGTGSPGGR